MTGVGSRLSWKSASVISRGGSALRAMIRVTDSWASSLRTTHKVVGSDHAQASAPARLAVTS
ncbi:MAG: hypothetical protein E6J90_05780 [Deltaproteobacteria bacterium]|nr:MAG: hypothetical protein E6J90_05780 [Deltaproteobacteria bacterium]